MTHNELTLWTVIIVGGFILAIIIIANFFGYLKYRAKVSATAIHSNTESMSKFSNDLTSIKKRLETLEKIVTDKNFQLHDEINNL